MARIAGGSDGSHRQTSNRPGTSGRTNISIKNSNINNAVIGAKSVTMRSNQTVYTKGTSRNEFNINGGNFVNSAIGSKGTTYNIKRGAAAPTNHAAEWNNFKVETAIVAILNCGMEKQQLLKLLKLGYKLKQIYEVMQDKSAKMVPILVTSMIKNTEKKAYN